MCFPFVSLLTHSKSAFASNSDSDSGSDSGAVRRMNMTERKTIRS